MSDLSTAYDALSAKNLPYTVDWRYADGDHPLTYTNERLKEVFRTLDAKFTENWCRLVIDSTLERINLTGFELEEEGAESDLMALWSELDLAQDADEIHEAALVCGEAFLVCWPDADGQPSAYYNDPRLCHVVYDPENQRLARYAAKWWDDEQGQRRLTLYYPDHLEYYVARNKADNVGSVAAFQPAELPSAPNPYGEIPVFHFRMRRRAVISDLADVIPVQNGLNKLLSDMMVAAEYGAFAQRWVISNSDTLGKLKNAPNEIWHLPAGDGVSQQTQIGQFTPTDLKNYLDAIDRLAMSIAIITRTPKHYFSAQGGDPSGEALIALEAPLNKKAQHRINRFTPTWRHAAAFLLRLAGTTVDPETITPRFDRPETVQPRTQAEIRQMSISSGIPLVTMLQREGWNESELAGLAHEQEIARKSYLQWAIQDRQRALLDQQLGASQATLLEQLGYDPDQEAERKQGQAAELGEQLLTAFDRDIGTTEMNTGMTRPATPGAAMPSRKRNVPGDQSDFPDATAETATLEA